MLNLLIVSYFIFFTYVFIIIIITRKKSDYTNQQLTTKRITRIILESYDSSIKCSNIMIYRTLASLAALFANKKIYIRYYYTYLKYILYIVLVILFMLIIENK